MRTAFAPSHVAGADGRAREVRDAPRVETVLLDARRFVVIGPLHEAWGDVVSMEPDPDLRDAFVLLDAPEGASQVEVDRARSRCYAQGAASVRVRRPEGRASVPEPAAGDSPSPGPRGARAAVMELAEEVPSADRAALRKVVLDVVEEVGL